MDPSAAELEQIGSAPNPLVALLEFVGMTDAVKEAMWEELGEVEKVRELVYIPKEDWDEAVAAARIPRAGGGGEGQPGQENAAEPRKLKPRDKAQVGMLRRYARLLVGLAGDETGGGLPAGSSGTQPPAGQESGQLVVAAAGDSGKRKFKMSAVVDQRDEQEAVAIGAEDFRAAVKRYKEANDGLHPTEAEEATPDQLQGIAVKLRQDVVPYADFGVLRPYGLRLERTLKFHARLWDPTKAEFVAKELPGPPSLAEWLRSWKVYTFIMIALGAASRARLERYRERVVALAEKYGGIRGDSWWIVALADQRMRSERMERLRRELESANGDIGYGGVVLDKKCPWDAVFLRAATDTEFWNAEVVEVALLFAAKVKDRAELVDPGHHVKVAGEARPAQGAAEGGSRADGVSRARAAKDRRKVAAKTRGEHEKHETSGKGGGKSKSSKGKSKGKLQICYAWNRDEAGCKSPCPNGRAHVCEMCGSPDHKGKNCTAR